MEFTEGVCVGQLSDKGRKMSILSCAIACRASPFFIFGTHEYGATDKCSAEGACDCRCQEGVNGACNKVTSSKYNAFRITQSGLPGTYRMDGQGSKRSLLMCILLVDINGTKFVLSKIQNNEYICLLMSFQIYNRLHQLWGHQARI